MVPSEGAPLLGGWKAQVKGECCVCAGSQLPQQKLQQQPWAQGGFKLEEGAVCGRGCLFPITGRLFSGGVHRQRSPDPHGLL